MQVPLRPPGRGCVAPPTPDRRRARSGACMDWQGWFALESPLEMVVRGSAMYWFLFLLFRVVIRRRVGAVGIGDVLLLVIIADAAQNAMAGEYRSVSDGIVLVSTIVGWNLLN